MKWGEEVVGGNGGVGDAGTAYMYAELLSDCT